ncbi:MAG: hypothetical protein NWS85_10995 [Hydrogenophaga sp.]|jgi:hypothetical protein|nr:hypothetical protein [Hydrogenophaga sp.]
MTVWLLILHVVNFVLPALVMALFMPIAGRWVMGPANGRWLRRFGTHVVTGVLVLLLGLVVQGQDGKMSTYIGLVFTAATTEWWLRRAWHLK